MPFDAAPIAIKIDCLICPVQSCLARRGSPEQATAFGDILAPRIALMPGRGALYRNGDRLRSIYSVRGGCIKASTFDSDGNERIRGFYLPGDLIGLDALGDGTCLATAAAVVPSQICAAPISELRQLMLRNPELAQRVMEQTSRELALALALSGDYSAEQRLAAFLLQMRDRMGGGSVLRLPMAQRDIGNYLRLATETVCRTLKSLERCGLVSLADRSVRILSEARLGQIAEPVGLLRQQEWISHAA